MSPLQQAGQNCHAKSLTCRRMWEGRGQRDLRATKEFLSRTCQCFWNTTCSLPLSYSHTGLCFIILPTLKSLLLPRLSWVIYNADASLSNAVLQVRWKGEFQQGATVLPGVAEIKCSVNIKHRPWPPLVPTAGLDLLTGWKPSYFCMNPCLLARFQLR